VRISAIHDRDSRYVGPLLIWRTLTGQARLEAQFEETVGMIARTVLDSAETMRAAAVALRQSATLAYGRTVAVAAASDQAAGNVATVATGAEELAVSVAEIGRQVQESTQIAAWAAAEARETDSSVGNLNEAANRISAVIRLITGIAERTNLLALNATIEAARAGEAGKGFAVVATEVKHLATQTARATDDIGSQITAIQEATSRAVAALHSIGGTIERMSEITAAIAASVTQQETATRSIAEAVQHAAAGTAEVNTNIAAVNSVVDETGSRADTVLEAAIRMAEQAAALQQEVAQFLVAVRQAT
jgi:methyl-accepting chemotaxis protein